MKKILTFGLLIAVCNTNMLAEVLYTCDSAKSDTNKGYNKSSMKLKIIRKKKKTYVRSGGRENELIYLGGGQNAQFLEHVSSGHSVLYTIQMPSKIMTIQKSYDLAGPIMVNIILQCH